jgi:nitrogen regulatory protein PII
MSNDLFTLQVYVYIVNHGQADRVIKIAYEEGVPGATVFYGYGTVNKGLLYWLGLNDSRKEIVLMVSDSETGNRAMQAIIHKKQMHKLHQGIAFSLPLLQLIGSKKIKPEDSTLEKEVKPMEYQAIFTIVDKGKSENVIDAAYRAGATGGTVINARGSGIHETQRIFNIPIEPEKEVVLIIAKTEIVSKITDEIRKDLRIDEPGRGIIFISDVSQTYGLFNPDSSKK